MKVLVTGATGHLGNVLTKALKNRGDEVTAFILPGEDIAEIMPYCDHILYGNVLDLQSLIIAFRGIDVVFHTAGIIDISSSKKMRKLMQSVNIGGVHNVITACKDAHVSRLIYTSSVHAIQEKDGKETMYESSSFNPKFIKGSYAKTKAIATQAVLNATKEGLDAVVVHPAGIIGPEDYSMSHMGTMVYNFLTGKLRAYTSGGYNFVDVRDVVSGILSAQEKGVSGECYILSGEYHSLKEMIHLMKDVTKSKRRLVWIPHWLALIFSPFAQLYYRIFKLKPLFTPYSLSTLMSNSNYSHEKAKNTFGYAVTKFKKTLEDTIRWTTEHYHLPVSKRKKEKLKKKELNKKSKT